MRRSPWYAQAPRARAWRRSAFSQKTRLRRVGPVPWGCGTDAAHNVGCTDRSPIFGPSAVALGRGAAPLGLQAACLRRARRPRRAARRAYVQCPREALLEPRQRQLAVARLRACVLCDRADDRSAARDDAALLVLAQRA